MEGLQRSPKFPNNPNRWGAATGFRTVLFIAGIALSAVSLHQGRPVSATIRVGVVDLELEHNMSQSMTKYGLTPSGYNLGSGPFPVFSQGMKDGSVWVMYSHCPDGDFFVEKEANRVGTVGNNYIGCEAHIAHYDGNTGKRIGKEVVFADYTKYPMQRNVGFFVHGPDDGEHSNTFVLGIWTAQCQKIEDVCLCTNDKCGFDLGKNKACNANWRGVPGVTYCQNDNWLGGTNGTGWSCGKSKYNVGTLVAPVNSGQIPARLVLVKLKSNGKVIWEQNAFFFDGDQNDGGSTIIGGIAKFKDPDLKREVEDWAYAWIHSSNMGNICNYHWGCQGHVHRATDGKQTEERLWCSHCNGRFLTYDEPTKRFAFACGTDGVPGVVFDKTKVIGRGSTSNINTSQDNTHRDVHPVVAHYRDDIWLILYCYIATDFDKDPNDLRLLHYDVKAKKILFSKVLTETPKYSDAGSHRLLKFGPDTWLMAWEAQGRRLLAEIDAWGNFVGDIHDVTDDITWGGSQMGWWHWPNNDIGFVWSWDQRVSFEEKGKLVVTAGHKSDKVLRLVRIRGFTGEKDCIGKFLPMEFTCNMCCEIREKYVVERPRDGGKDCPYKDGEIRRKPCKGGDCPMLERESAVQGFTKEESATVGKAELGIDGNMETIAASWTNYGNFPLTWYKVTLKHKSRVKGVSYFLKKGAQKDLDLNVLFYDAENTLLARCFLDGKKLPEDDTKAPLDDQGCSGLNVIGVKQVMVIPVSAGPWAWLYLRELQIFGEPCSC